jgi:hypothetical protein
MMEKLTIGELKRALAKFEKDRILIIEKMWTNRKERKQLEEEFDYSCEIVEDFKKRIVNFKKNKSEQR